MFSKINKRKFALKSWLKWKKAENCKVIKKLKPYIKMDKKIINFDDTEIEEYKFHQNE